MEADSYQRLIVAYRNGQPVRLCDVGTAVDSVENDQVAAWYTAHGQRDRSIVLAIQRQPGTNTIEVADAVKALLPNFRREAARLGQPRHPPRQQRVRSTTPPRTCSSRCC